MVAVIVAMQERGVLRVCATLLAVFRVADASAAFLAKSKSSNVATLGLHAQEVMQMSRKPKYSGYEPRMKEVHHSKESGNGYHPGSPLYDKQEERKEKGIESDITPALGFDYTDWREYEHEWEKTGGFEGHIVRSVWTCLPVIIMTFLFALVYVKVIGRHEPVVQKTVMQGADGFSYGLCSFDNMVGSHAGICLCSFCCLPIRWADTMSKEPVPKFMNFWVALSALSVLWFLSEATLGILGFLCLGMLIYFRQKLRREFGIVNCFDGAPLTLVQDCLVWFCCGCCAAVQEARQVEFCQAAKAMSRQQYPPTAAGMMYQSTSQFQFQGPSQFQSGTSSMPAQRM